MNSAELNIEGRSVEEKIAKLILEFEQQHEHNLTIGNIQLLHVEDCAKNKLISDVKITIEINTRALLGGKK